MFPGLVSRALTVEVLSPGVSGNRDNALQVVSEVFIDADVQTQHLLLSAS